VLVESYLVAPLINLKENSNFRILDNIFIDVDAKELNVVLSSRGQAQVDEDDNSNIITVEDCNGVDNE